jgi:hypothetical protein
MSTPNPFLSAAIPELVAVLNAVKQFNVDMGADPTKWVLTFPGAQLKLLGSIQLQVPALAGAEAGAAQTAVNSKIDGWITSLQAKA